MLMELLHMSVNTLSSILALVLRIVSALGGLEYYIDVVMISMFLILRFLRMYLFVFREDTVVHCDSYLTIE